jgi:hypothetical protein
LKLELLVLSMMRASMTIEEWKDQQKSCRHLMRVQMRLVCDCSWRRAAMSKNATSAPVSNAR